MRPHVRYGCYLARHKWFVFVACLSRALLCPTLLWRGIIHDWSKFLPSEWFAYVQSFYGRGPELNQCEPCDRDFDIKFEQAAIRYAFDCAWLKHQHRNSHHWQHWCLREDSGGVKVLKMPYVDMMEMVCDWEGAGRAITGKKGGTCDWYDDNRHIIQLHPDTRRAVEMALGYQSGKYCPF